MSFNHEVTLDMSHSDVPSNATLPLANASLDNPLAIGSPSVPSVTHPIQASVFGDTSVLVPVKASPVEVAQHATTSPPEVPLGRPQRITQLPARYRDVAPQAPAPFSEAVQAPTSITSPPPSIAITLNIPPLRTLTTSENIFGVYRRFHVIDMPTTDPEAHLTPNELTEAPDPTEDSVGLLSPLFSLPSPSLHSPPSSRGMFFPYGNRSSFALGDWYWNNGAQKSLSGFRALLEIIGDPSFEPEDLKKTRWAEVNKMLAGDIYGEGSDSCEWLDDGWRCTSISIQVPFHRRTKRKGSESFVSGELYHRSIVAVMKEQAA
ncbi:hypothetical protein DXG01_015413 [Tephrocybe rancida]|nr:hypothetical protein DXG01_015413 [Tephrocybe rancida]